MLGRFHESVENVREEDLGTPHLNLACYLSSGIDDVNVRGGWACYSPDDCLIVKPKQRLRRRRYGVLCGADGLTEVLGAAAEAIRVPVHASGYS